MWRRPRKLKLGNAVAVVAQPVAAALDYLLKSDLKNCGGCAKRKDRLNELFDKPKD